MTSGCERVESLVHGFAISATTASQFSATRWNESDFSNVVSKRLDQFVTNFRLYVKV